jgi:prepilin peptidase CpaA
MAGRQELKWKSRSKTWAIQFDQAEPEIPNMPSSFLPLPVIVVGLAALAAAIIDLWKFKVHNLLTLPLLVTGLAYHTLMAEWYGFANSLLGILFGFSALFVFYLMGGMGAGDVKLVAGLGAWLGFWLTLFVFLTTALAGGLYSVGMILYRGRLRETWLNFRIIWYRVAATSKHFTAEDGVELEVGREDRRQRVIPYASMVAIGVLTLFLMAWREGVLHLLAP